MTAPVSITDDFSKSRVVQAYNFFVESLDTSKLNYTTIVGKTHFVRIDLDANDDEQQIFDSLNSLGVSLTTSELLKNYFFSRNNLTDYQTIWEPVFDNSAATKEYWDTIIETGRIRRPLIDIFLMLIFNCSSKIKIQYQHRRQVDLCPHRSTVKFLSELCGQLLRRKQTDHPFLSEGVCRVVP